jgi:hypothetical protein
VIEIAWLDFSFDVARDLITKNDAYTHRVAHARVLPEPLNAGIREEFRARNNMNAG